MRAAVYRGPRDMRIEERPDPAPGPLDVVCEVLACGICGSDLHGYKLGMWAEPGWTMGHEVSLRVSAIGADVQGIEVGERIFPLGGRRPACGECFWCGKGQRHLCERRPPGQPVGYSDQGGYAEAVLLRELGSGDRVWKIPDALSPEHATFVEPLLGALRWVAQAEPEPGETAVLIGSGTIGLLCLQVLKLAGTRVIVVEPSALRRRLAAELGADVVIDPAEEDPLERVTGETRRGRFFFGEGGAAADCVLECAGKPETLQLALEMTRSGGRVVLVGLYEEPAPINPNLVIHKNLRLVSSFGHAPPGPLGDETPVELLAAGKVRVDPLITHRFPLARIGEAFEQQLRPSDTVKALILPREA